MASSAPVLPDTMLSLSRVGDVAVLSLSAPAILEDEATVLGRYLTELARQSEGLVAVELSGVMRFGCAWINTLISVSKRCDEMCGRLVVCGLTPSALHLIRNTGIDKYLTVTENRREALRVLGEPSVNAWRLAVARLLDIPVAGRAA